MLSAFWFTEACDWDHKQEIVPIWGIIINALMRWRFREVQELNFPNKNKANGKYRRSLIEQ